MFFNGKIIRNETIDKFWSRVDIKENEYCWEWKAGKNSNKTGYNYGIFWLNGKGILSHRIALSFHINRWLSDGEVMHTCDNPPCCNPHHLIIGTHLDNMRDCAIKGRRPIMRGENNPRAKLSNAKVISIKKRLRNRTDLISEINNLKNSIAELNSKLIKARRMLDAESMSAIARDHKIDSALVHRINKGVAWTHCEE